MDLWTTITHLEKEHNCRIYGILDQQSLAEDLSTWYAFDENEKHEDFLMSSYDIPTELMTQAMDVALANAGCDFDNYNSLVEEVGDYIIQSLKERQCVCGEIDCQDEYAHTTSGV